MDLTFTNLLWLAQGAFTIWMLVDAYRRGAETFWYYVIIFVPLLGPLAYFFAVKLSDFSPSSWRDWTLWQRRPSLQELRYRAEQTPTLANNLALGERLVERKEYDAAAAYLERVLAREPDLATALYPLAVCRRTQNRLDDAVALLERILARDKAWGNYAALHMLVEVHGERGDPERALAACRDLARLAPTLQYQYLLAEQLIDQQQEAEARELLERALEANQYAPGFVRRRNSAWAGKARHLLRELSTE
jgi:hypothetical protein